MTADCAREMYHQNYDLLEGGILMLAADGAEQVIFASRPAAGLYECDSEEEFLTFISSRFQNMMVPEDYKPVKEIVNPETGRFHITFHYLTRQKQTENLTKILIFLVCMISSEKRCAARW